MEKSEKKLTQSEKVEQLESRVNKLESVLCQIATLGGYGNYLKQHGLSKWEPTKKDMSKYSN